MEDPDRLTHDKPWHDAAEDDPESIVVPPSHLTRGTENDKTPPSDAPKDEDA